VIVEASAPRATRLREMAQERGLPDTIATWQIISPELTKRAVLLKTQIEIRDL
jgi:hypothetical protein